MKTRVRYYSGIPAYLTVEALLEPGETTPNYSSPDNPIVGECYVETTFYTDGGIDQFVRDNPPTNWLKLMNGSDLKIINHL